MLLRFITSASLFIIFLTGCSDLSPIDSPNLETNPETSTSELIRVTLEHFETNTQLPADWKTIQPKEANFRIAMPNSSELTDKRIMYLAMGEPCYILLFSERPVGSATEELLKLYMEKFIGTDEVVYTNDLDVGAEVVCRAVACKIENDEYQIFRIYVTQAKVYVLSASLNRKHIQSDAVKHYFGSFEIQID